MVLGGREDTATVNSWSTRWKIMTSPYLHEGRLLNGTSHAHRRNHVALERRQPNWTRNRCCRSRRSETRPPCDGPPPCLAGTTRKLPLSQCFQFCSPWSQASQKPQVKGALSTGVGGLIASLL